MQLLFLALVFVGMTRYADAFVVDDGNVDVYFIEFCLVFCFSFKLFFGCVSRWMNWRGDGRTSE